MMTFLFFIGGFGLPVELSQAKEMHGKIGLGYNAQFGSISGALSTGVPALSLRYGLAPGVQMEAIGGFSSGSNRSSVAGVKFMQRLFSETYANFYYLAGGGLVSNTARSGTEFLGGFGTEFFIPGLERIGWAFEAGMSFENVTTPSFTLKTFGHSFLQAGMHYYF